MSLKQLINILIIGLLCIQCSGQEPQPTQTTATETVVTKPKKKLPIVVGAEKTSHYLNELKGKKVGIVANHTSMIKGTHLVDSLLSLNIKVIRVFSPEHGFRGNADAGEKVTSTTDKKTGISIVSLYGKNKKPYLNKSMTWMF